MSPQEANPRPAARRRGALVLAALALWLAAAATHAHADDPPLPEKTSRNVGGLPPYGPPTWKEQTRMLAWCEAAIGLAAEQGATRHAADLVFSVADVQHAHVHDAARATRHYAHAAEVYDADDITRGVVLLRWFRLEVDRGNQPAAARVLGALQDYIDLRAPRDLEESEAVRWDVWTIERRRDLPQHLAAHHEANGRFEDAAKVREQLAREEADLFDRAHRAALYERAARAYHRAAMRDDAVRAMDAAIELTDDERRKAELRFWRLHAQHGLLSPEGSPRVTADWPDGGAFEDDARAYLREIQGVEGMGTKYLALGSRAHLARRFEIAVEIYMLALRDPSLVAAARKDPSIWRGLLMGYSAAMELERFDEAEQILEIVERVADEPIQEKDAYGLAVAKARQWVAERPIREAARRKLAAAKQKRAEREAARLRRARMETGAAARDEPGLGPAETQGGDDVPFLLVLGVLLGAYVLGILIVRRIRA